MRVASSSGGPVPSPKVTDMQSQLVKQQKYGFSRKIDAAFDEATERTRAALGKEGFGILSEIRIDEKLKEKLGVDFRRYVILGACNPPLAYRTLLEDIEVGLLLPCNVIVYEADDKNGSVVAAIDPIEMMSMIDNAAIHQVANEVHERLQKVIAML